VYDYAIGSPAYEKSFIDSPGVSGCGIVRFDFREQRLTFFCFYVNDTEAAVIAAIQADFAALANTAFTTVMETTNSWYRCELDPASNFTHVASTGLPSAKFYARATMVVIAKGLA